MVDNNVRLTIIAELKDANVRSRIKSLFDGIKPPQDILGLKEASKTLQKGLSGLKLPKGLNEVFKGNFQALNTELRNYEKIMSKPNLTKADAAAATQSAQKIRQLYQEITRDIQNLNSKQVSPAIKTDGLKQLEKELVKNQKIMDETAKKAEEVAKNLFSQKSFSTPFDKIKKALSKSSTGRQAMADIEKSLGLGQYEAAIKKFEELRSKANLKSVSGDGGAYKNASAYLGAITKLQNQIRAVGQESINANHNIMAIKKTMGSIEGKGLARTSTEIKKMGDYAKQSSDAFRTMDKNFSKTIQQSAYQQRQVSDLRSQVNYFFGLQNQIFLFKRAVREAIETVKELDESMTQTAVVTDFSVGDMWDQLPKYTAKANELGVAINDVYKANTLYFQQGLDEKQSMELGTETLKMARIANMDAAEATDLMTAALRGFNMELNATSAQRVNDVYSKLAAITASDTHEIGIAVSKTASLASSSGMDLETTSALLAQIIETTREAPETAGTALKTIIARFGDIKSIISEGKSFGQDEEGEDIYVNRVDKALATAGIRLKDFATGQEGLGEVFLKLGKRWDSLSVSQQRYIATQSSGARQQSRFIAMLQDYGRTQELVNAAYNSNGAAEVQFQKIQDSYDAKMKKMKNAWDEFIMGFSNEKIIKGGVDATTGVLDTINKVIKGATDGVKGFNETLGNTLKTITTLGIGLAGLKIAGGIFDKLAGGIAGAFMARPGGMMRGFKNGLSYNEEEAEQRKNRHYHNVMPEYRKRMKSIAPAYLESYKTLNTFTEEERQKGYAPIGMSQISQKPVVKDTFDLGKINKELSKWDDDSQSQMFKQSPRVKRGIKQTFKEAINSADYDKTTKNIAMGTLKGVFKQMENGELTPALGTGKLLDKSLFEEALGREEAQKIYDQLEKTRPKAPKIKEGASQIKRLSTIKEANVAEGGVANYIRPEFKGEKYNPVRGSDGFKMKAGERMPFFDKVGNAAQNAGIKVQQFGMALSSLGFETLGSLASGFGTAIMGIVPAITSVTGRFKEFRALVKETSLSNALGETFSSPLSKIALGATAVIGSYMLIKKRQQDLIESGKKVFDTYTKQKDNIEKNASTLDGMKDKFAELSKGVDKYGKNISLSTSKYKEYQEMVDKITKMSPELIKGYNSEGKAIIDNSTAIEEAYKSQKTAKEDNIKDFVTNSAVDKVAKGIRAKDTFKDLTKSNNLNSNTINAMGDDFTKISKAINEADIETNAFKDSLDKLSGSSIEMGNLSASNLQFIANHEQDLSRMIMSKSKKELSDEQKTAIQDSFSEYKQNWAKLRTEIDPIVQQMTQYLSQEGFSPEKGGKIGEDFVVAFNNGIQDLSLKGLTSGWDGETFKKESLNFAKEISQATGNNSDYIKELNTIKEAQQDYLKNIDDMSAVGKYNEDISGATAALDELAEKQDKATASGRALAETMHEQAEAARNFTEDYEIDIGDALNNAQSEIEAARKSYESFQKEIESGDFYTANENKKKIYDEIRDSKGKSASEIYSSNVDDAGQGSVTYYKGARDILGDNFVDKNFGNVKKINKQLDYVSKGFEAGQKGVNGFTQIMLDNKDKLIKAGYVKDDGKTNSFEFADKAQEDGAHAEIARILKMSEGTFVSMADQAQQYTNINFANMDKISAFLKQNGVVGKDQSYYSKKALTDEMDAQNMGKRQRDFVFENLKKDNIKLVTEGSFTKGEKGREFTSSFLGQQGIKATDIIAKTGENFKDSLKSISKIFEGVGITDAETINKILNEQLPEGEKKFKKEDIESAQKELQQEEENPLDSSTNTHVSSIDSKMDTLITASGVLTTDAKKKYEKLGGKEGEKAKDAKARKEFDEVAKDKNIFSSSKNYDEAKNSMQKTIDETSNAIEELKALKNKATSDEEKEKYANWIGNLGTNLKYYNKIKDSNDKEWKSVNQESFDRTGVSLDNGKKGGQKKTNENFRNNYGVDFSTAWNNPASAASIKSIIGYLNQGNISRNNQLQVKEDYINQHSQEIGKMNSYEAFNFMKALGPITDSTRDNLIKLNNAFKENKKATDDNSNSKKQNTKQERKRNKKDNQKKEETSSQSNNGSKPYKSSKYRVDGEIRASKGSEQKKQDRGLIGNWLYGIYKNGFIKKGTQIKETQKGVRGGSFLGGATDASKGNTKGIKNKVAKIKAEVTGKKDVDTLGASIKKLPKSKKPKIKPDVKGKGDVKTLGTTIKKLPKSRKPKVKADVKGQKKAENLRTAIENVPKKTKAKLTANTSGLSDAQSLNSEVSSFESKGDHTVTLTVNKVVNNKKNPHTGGFITGEGGNQAVQYRKKGGKIFQRDGTDTVPAMLTPGEYVHKRSTVEHFGVDFMRKINHKDLGGALATLGSSAKGKKGTLGPDDKGGLTLTGEKGFEVAWIPSENRSAILGLNGPEIVDLPSDTVVYDHEQSKRIASGNKLKANMGSMAAGGSKLDKPPKEKGKGKGKSKDPSKDLKDAAKDSKKASKNSKKASKKWLSVGTVWERATGKISVWWDNIKRGIEAAQKRFNQHVDKFSKLINSPVTTAVQAFDQIRVAAKEAAMGLKLNMRAYERASKELKELVYGKTKTTTKFVPEMKTVLKGKTGRQIAKYQKLKKKGKKRTKKENKQYKKLKKNLRKKKVIDKKGNLTKKGKSYYKKVPKRKVTKTGRQILKYEKLRKKGKKRTKKENKQYKKLKNTLKKKKVLNKKGGVKASARKANIKTKGKKRKVTTVDKTGKNWQQISWQKKGLKISGKGKKGKTAAKKFKKFKQGGKGSKAAKAWLKKRKYINKKGNLTKKGKKLIKAKKITKDKKLKMDLSKYLKYDKDLGTWAIDEKALNKVKDKNQKKALKDKLNEQLDDLIQKQNEYREALEEYKNQFVDMGDQVYEKFDTWKRELDKIAVITQNIANTQAKSALATSRLDLLYNKFLSNFSNMLPQEEDVGRLKETIQAFFNANTQKQQQIIENREEINKKREGAYNSSNEEKAFKKAEANYNSVDKQIKALEKEYTDKQGTLTIANNPKYGELIAERERLKRIKDDRNFDLLVKQAMQRAVKRSEKQPDGTYAYTINLNELDKIAEENKLDDSAMDALQSSINDIIGLEESYLQTFADEIDNANSSLQFVIELQQTLSDLTQEMVSVLEDRAQKAIDRQSKINDTIKNETSKLLDGIKKSLDQRRQEEQNAKTEQEISDKQKRLAYLQSDTAGGHQVEIAQLQKEIDDSQKGYKESLEDQTINALQQQADEAAEQRERQIQILQSQLDYQKETNYFAKRVDQLLTDIGNQENLKVRQEAINTVTELLKEGREKDQEQTEATEKINKGEVGKAIAQLEVLPGLIADNLIDKAKSEQNEQNEQKNIEILTDTVLKDTDKPVGENGKKVETITDNNFENKLNTVIESTSLGNTGSLIKKEVDNKIAQINTESAKAAANKAAAEKTAKEKALKAYKDFLYDRGNKKKTKDKNWGKIGKDGLKAQIARGNTLGYNTRKVLQDLANTEALSWDEVLKAYIGYRGNKAAAEKSIRNWWGKNPSKARRSGFKTAFGKKYATGGLANYTGPAWLDGTKTKPELVLNAQDTKNFLALKDTLSGLQNEQFASQSNGDLNFDIDINVEKIDSDYDVKKVAEVVKKEIVQSAKYRNVNIIRNLK